MSKCKKLQTRNDPLLKTCNCVILKTCISIYVCQSFYKVCLFVLFAAERETWVVFFRSNYFSGCRPKKSELSEHVLRFEIDLDMSNQISRCRLNNVSQNCKSLQWWYIYCLMLRTLYNNIMDNFSISLAVYEWIERERVTDEDGCQTHAFLLGRCFRPHWVRWFLAVEGPGCCLVEVVLGNSVVVFKKLTTNPSCQSWWLTSVAAFNSPF